MKYEFVGISEFWSLKYFTLFSSYNMVAVVMVARKKSLLNPFTDPQKRPIRYSQRYIEESNTTKPERKSCLKLFYTENGFKLKYIYWFSLL
jgi:hypothetical protein